MTPKHLYERSVDVYERSLMRATNKSMTNLPENSESFIMFMRGLLNKYMTFDSMKILRDVCERYVRNV